MTAAISRLVSPRGAALLAGAARQRVRPLLVVLAPPTATRRPILPWTLLVEQGVLVWDNLWYGGYIRSPLQPPLHLPAALVGNLPLVFAAFVLSAALFIRGRA